MNKGELVESVAKEVGLSQKDAKAAVDAVVNSITAALKKRSDGQVSLVGFGTFKTVKRKARKGTNPKTGEAMKIPARKTVSFKPGKALKDAVA